MFSRRDFLKTALLATAAPQLILPEEIQAAERGREPWRHMAQMPLYLVRGKETFQLDLRKVGHFSTFRYITRDVKAGKIGYPDPELGGLLSWIQSVIAVRTGKFTPLYITSGMRTQETNSKIEGAARNSMHLPDSQGLFRAIDLHSKDVSPRQIASLAKMAQEGGVGLYSDRGFLHIDTGRVRTWGK